METLLFVAVWLFAVTHLDTLVVLVAFCADEDYRTIEILVGHYAGFGVGLAGAVIAATVAAELFAGWTFLLGIVPLGMGLWGLLSRSPEEAVEDSAIVPDRAGRIGIVTGAGIGLSGENLAVFIPFFARLSAADLAIVVGLYLLGAAVVFLFALAIARRAAAVGLPRWIDRWLVPAVLTIVGAYVLLAGLFVG